MTSAVLEVVSAGMSHAGRLRQRNEDSFLMARPVYIVADGLGGHSRGDAASAAVVEAFREISGRDWLTSEELLETLAIATERVRALDTGVGAPGSTLSGVALTDQGGIPCWLVFNIGDSRTYLLGDGTLTQLTVDHAAQRRTGSAPTATRSVITRAIGAGIERPPMADQWFVPAREGHRILICSDGLTNEVTDPLIQASLMTAADPHDAAALLVDAALEAGGRDNVTVVVVDAISVKESAPAFVASTGDTVPDVTDPGEEGFAPADTATVEVDIR